MADIPDSITDRSLLVMDDDAPLRNRLARALESRGFKVKTAAGVQEALEIARAMHACLLIRRLAALP